MKGNAMSKSHTAANDKRYERLVRKLTRKERDQQRISKRREKRLIQNFLTTSR